MHLPLELLKKFWFFSLKKTKVREKDDIVPHRDFFYYYYYYFFFLSFFIYRPPEHQEIKR